MDYLKESGASIHRRRRRQRTAVTLTVVTLLLLGTFVYSAAYVQGWIDTRTPDPASNAACAGKATSAKALTPRMVSINVYNSTSRDGLAASVAESLQSLGFKVGKVGNDPLSQTILGIGEIRRGPTGVAGGALAAARLAGAKVVLDERTDDTVDMVLGNRFTRLSTPSRATRANAPKTALSC